MIVRIDLDDSSPFDTTIADPSEITDENGDECTLRFREIEIAMSMPQIVGFAATIQRWLFRGGTHDFNDAVYSDHQEHEVLRGIVKALQEGDLDGVEVPEKIRWAIAARMRQLDAVDPDDWASQREELRSAKARIAELEEELAMRARRSKTRSKP